MECKFYLRGTCRFGDKCNYLHSKQSERVQIFYPYVFVSNMEKHHNITSRRPPRYATQAKLITSALAKSVELPEESKIFFYEGDAILSPSDIERGFFGECFKALVQHGLVRSFFCLALKSRDTLTRVVYSRLTF